MPSFKRIGSETDPTGVVVILDLNDKSVNSYDLCREIKEKYG